MHGSCSSRRTSELCDDEPIRAWPQLCLSVSHLACRLSETGRLFTLVVSRSCHSGCTLFLTGSYPNAENLTYGTVILTGSFGRRAEVHGQLANGRAPR